MTVSDKNSGWPLTRRLFTWTTFWSYRTARISSSLSGVTERTFFYSVIIFISSLLILLCSYSLLLFLRNDFLFYSVFTVFPFNTLILDGALKLRVWISCQYQTPCLNYPLVFLIKCYPFNCRKKLFIYILPPENVLFLPTLFYRTWTRPDAFFRVILRVVREKLQSIKTRRKIYSARTLIPYLHLRHSSLVPHFIFSLS